MQNERHGCDGFIFCSCLAYYHPNMYVLAHRRALGLMLIALIVAVIFTNFVPHVARSQQMADFSSRIRPIAGGKFEASGVVHVNGTNGFLFVDDSRTRDVLWLELTSTGGQKAAPVPIPLGTEIVDPEGMTTDGKYTYIVGSQSKSRGLAGIGLMRFVYDPQRRMIQSIESIRELKAFLARGLVELRNAEINIEGLTWDPRQNRLLLGLRAPLNNGQALLIPLKLRKPDGPFATDNITVEPALTLQLDGAGIRSIEYDSSRNGFLVIAGPSQDKEDREFRLLLWPGMTSPDLRPPAIVQFADNLKPEGVTSATLQGSETTMIVFDTSRYAIGLSQ